MPTPAPDTAAAPPRVSVIIPLYNHERFIREAVQSVLDQSYPDFELIIINDGSTDGSEAVVQGIVDDRITYIYQDNQGAHNTINRGVRRARGEFVSILNSDDVYAPRRLEEFVKLLDGDPSLFAAFSDVDYIDENGTFMKSVKRKEHVWSAHEPETSFKDEDNLVLDLLAGNFLITTSNLFCRKSVFDRIGFFSGLRYAHDYDFFLRLCYHCKADIIESPLVKYRVHGGNTLKADDPEVSFEVGLTLAHFFLQYGVANIVPESLRNASVSEILMKFFNSVNTFRADRQMMVLLLFGMHDAEARDELFRTLSEATENPFRTSCVEYFKAYPEGWARWREANERLIAREKELQEGWAQWQQTNEQLIAREKELQEGWAQWQQTNERLIAKDKELQEGWAQWQQTNERLIARERELRDEQEQLAAAHERLTVAHGQIIEKDAHIRALLHSRSYRLGRALTWPWRKLRGRS